MTAAAAQTPRALTWHARGMAVGLAAGLAAIALVALLPDAFAYVYLGAQLGRCRLGLLRVRRRRRPPVRHRRPGRSAASSWPWGALGAYHHSTLLLGIGFLAHGAWDWVHHDDHGPTHVRTWYPPFCVVVDVVIGLPLLAGVVL